MSPILAPYHHSMQLGQGYNSFLLSPCQYDAVTVVPPVQEITKSPVPVEFHGSQTVSYSSQIATRLSDVARSMGVSAGSSIKKGAVAQPGHSSDIDESKFVDSDLNVIISVKVTNQEVTETPALHTFNPPNPDLFPKSVDVTAVLIAEALRPYNIVPISQSKSNSAKFNEIYGDCYVSGFIQGGELHAVVSVKILDHTQKSRIKKSILGRLNAHGKPDSDRSRDEKTLDDHLHETETTITVNWSGGGQIKTDNEEWSLKSLYKVAAAFPAGVSASPQKTWAILTPYANNASFLKWAFQHGVTSYDYSHARLQASDLFDMYIGYKNNIRRIQSIINHPEGYSLGPAKDAVDITVKDLVTARNDMRLSMAGVVAEIDKWSKCPDDIQQSEDTISKFTSPEVWATKLPVSSGLSPQARRALEDFSRLQADIRYSDSDLVDQFPVRQSDDESNPIDQSPVIPRSDKPADWKAKRIQELRVNPGKLTIDDIFDLILPERIIAHLEIPRGGSISGGERLLFHDFSSEQILRVIPREVVRARLSDDFIALELGLLAVRSYDECIEDESKYRRLLNILPKEVVVNTLQESDFITRDSFEYRYGYPPEGGDFESGVFDSITAEDIVMRMPLNLLLGCLRDFDPVWLPSRLYDGLVRSLPQKHDALDPPVYKVMNGKLVMA
ncbi:unnamed protein product [Rhizoctonia solani]|uniref:Uncharacterized protein n=1 Tax=Rhizoctonia solani TaxID=456999 RepID=A0A8H3C8Y6_9AGAM|nr:unnamed protein product [Rhizoctonia solani]